MRTQGGRRATRGRRLLGGTGSRPFSIPMDVPEADVPRGRITAGPGTHTFGFAGGVAHALRTSNARDTHAVRTSGAPAAVRCSNEVLWAPRHLRDGPGGIVEWQWAVHSSPRSPRPPQLLLFPLHPLPKKNVCKPPQAGAAGPRPAATPSPSPSPSPQKYLEGGGGGRGWASKDRAGPRSPPTGTPPPHVASSESGCAPPRPPLHIQAKKKTQQTSTFGNGHQDQITARVHCCRSAHSPTGPHLKVLCRAAFSSARQTGVMPIWNGIGLRLKFDRHVMGMVVRVVEMAHGDALLRDWLQQGTRAVRTRAWSGTLWLVDQMGGPWGGEWVGEVEEEKLTINRRRRGGVGEWRLPGEPDGNPGNRESNTPRPPCSRDTPGPKVMRRPSLRQGVGHVLCAADQTASRRHLDATRSDATCAPSP